MHLLTQLVRLVVPVACPGCGSPDIRLCRGCQDRLTEGVRRCEEDLPRLDRMDGCPPLPVWTSGTYAGPGRSLVLAWKDHGRADLGGVMAAAVRVTARDVAADLLGAGSRVAVGGAEACVLVVPAPSRPSAVRRRGADLVQGLARAVADELCLAGIPARPVRAVARRGRGRQAGLGARGRGRARDLVTLARGAEPSGRVHLLVDDVVTTGATLAACADVLAAAGGLVVGAVTLVATPSPARRFSDDDGRTNVGAWSWTADPS